LRVCGCIRRRFCGDFRLRASFTALRFAYFHRALSPASITVSQHLVYFGFRFSFPCNTAKFPTIQATRHDLSGGSGSRETSANCLQVRGGGPVNPGHGSGRGNYFMQLIRRIWRHNPTFSFVVDAGMGRNELHDGGRGRTGRCTLCLSERALTEVCMSTTMQDFSGFLLQCFSSSGVRDSRVSAERLLICPNT